MSLGDFRNARRTRLRGGASAMPQGGSADSQRDAWTLDALRRQCRSLVRNDELARAMVTRTAELAFPAEPRVQFKSDSAEFNRDAEAWIHTWMRACWHQAAAGPDGTLVGRSMGDGCRLALAEALRGGDSWVLPTTQRGLLQMIEAERVCNPATMAGAAGSPNGLGGSLTFAVVPEGQPGAGNTVVNGVEYDQTDTPVAVHIGRWSKETGGQRVVTDREGTRVEIEKIWHLPHPRLDEVNLTRPEPGLTCLVHRFEQLRAYIGNVATAAEMAAIFGLVIEAERIADLNLALPGSDVEKTAADGTGYTQRETELEPGFVFKAKPGEKIVQVKAEQPTTQFGDFVRSNLGMMAAEQGMPLVLWMLDMSQVNFASARVAVLLAGGVVGVWRDWAIRRLVEPAVRWRAKLALSQAINDGVGINGKWGMGMPGGVPMGWNKIEVSFPPLPVVDPFEFYRAEGYAIANGLKSFSAVQRAMGNDPEEAAMEQAKDRKMRQQLGILPVGVPGQVDPNPPTSPAPENP